MGIKYFVDEEFFTAWSDHMAYVLGYISTQMEILKTLLTCGEDMCELLAPIGIE